MIRRLAAFLTGLAWLVGPIPGARIVGAGHGGVVELSHAPAGPYLLSVWTQPTPSAVGLWRVDIVVMGESGVPITGAAVRVRAVQLENGAASADAEALRDSDPLGVRYRARLELSAGPWRVSVTVAGPAGPGALTFPIDVGPAGNGWLVASLGAAGLVILAAVGVLWRSGRGRRLAGSGLGLLLLVTPAWPHASLVRSSPARRATLTTAPDRVQLWFNEAVEPKFSTVSVRDAAGEQVDVGDAHVDPEEPKRLTVGLKRLGRGTYRVRFRVLSVDGHVVESEFPFTLRP